MLCTAFEERDMHRFRIFLKPPLYVTPIRFGRIQFLAKSPSIYTKICEEVGGNSPLQLSSRTHIVKIEDKKIMRKISPKNLIAGVFLAADIVRKMQCLS